MSKKTRRHHTPDQKINLLRRHHLKKADAPMQASLVRWAPACDPRPAYAGPLRSPSRSSSASLTSLRSIGLSGSACSALSTKFSSTCPTRVAEP